MGAGERLALGAEDRDGTGDGVVVAGAVGEEAVGAESGTDGHGLDILGGGDRQRERDRRCPAQGAQRGAGGAAQGLTVGGVVIGLRGVEGSEADEEDAAGGHALGGGDAHGRPGLAGELDRLRGVVERGGGGLGGVESAHLAVGYAEDEHGIAGLGRIRRRVAGGGGGTGHVFPFFVCGHCLRS
ncbi:Uncharacterised protein [Mycobacteroides abscessus subsp. abscessus]|nr:Uncharacterised protein [Mycobacteroides abscessus subsp. abscessus]